MAFGDTLGPASACPALLEIYQIDSNALTAEKSLVEEGESPALMQLTMSTTGDNRTAINSASLVVGQYFNLEVLAQDLRTPAKGVSAYYSNIRNSLPGNFEVVVGETQVLRATPNFGTGNFTLTLDGKTTVSINASSPSLMQGAIQSALEQILGQGAVSVRNERFVSGNIESVQMLVNFRKDWAGRDVPKITGDFSNLKDANNQPANITIIDNFTPADPNNASSFRNSLLRFGTSMFAIGGQVEPNSSTILRVGAAVPLPAETAQPTALFSIPLRAKAAGTSQFTIDFRDLVYPSDESILNPLVTLSSSQISTLPLTVTVGASARELGTIQGNFLLSGQSLSTPGGDLWYKFTTAGNGGAIDGARIDFSHSNGDLEFELYDANKVLIERSSSARNWESVSLFGQPTGVYFLRVYGHQTATNNFSLAITAPSASIPADRFESNNTREGATNLVAPPGQTVVDSLSIHTAGDLDFYRFETVTTGDASSFLSVAFSQAQGDIDLQLLDANGALLATSESPLNLEKISLEGRPAGVYYAKVLGRNTATNPLYQLTLNHPTLSIAPDRFEPNGSLANATALSAPQGFINVRDVSLHESTDSDWYKFQVIAAATASHFIEVSFSHAVSDVDVELLNRTGTILRSSATSQDVERINLAGLAADEYYLRAFSRNQKSLRTYELNGAIPVISIAPDAYESNDTRASASDLRFVTGEVSIENLSVHAPGDSDWFRFETVATSSSANFVGLVFDVAQGDLDLEIYDQSGTLVRSSLTSNNWELINLNGLAASTYYARVFGYRNATNPRYGFSILAPQTTIAPDVFEPNDSLALASDLRKVEGALKLSSLTLHAAGNADWYAFETTSTSDSRHEVRIDFSQAQGDLDFELMDAQGGILGASRGSSDSETISLSGLQPGKYALRVSGKTAATRSPAYQLTITAPESQFAPDRFEPNESRMNAYDLRAVAGVVDVSGGSIHRSGDEDWYRFETVLAGGSEHFIDVGFIHALGDLDIELFDSNGLFLRASRLTANNERISLNSLEAGAYYLRVYGLSGAINPTYDVRFVTPQFPTIVPDSLENNDALASASALRNNGETLAGSFRVSDLSLHTVSDVDYFQFTTVARGTLAHSISASTDGSGGGLRLTLMDATGRLIAESTGSGRDEFLSLSALDAGTYFVRVSPRTAQPIAGYQLSIDAPVAATGGAKDAWTIMVYMTSSDLEPFAFQDINELEEAARRLPGSVNVAVYWDQSSTGTSYPTGNQSQPSWGTTGRAFIRPDSSLESISTVFDVGLEANSGDSATLAGFLSWATQNAPSEKYALINWDHGSGIYGSNFDNLDGAPSDNLRVSELVAALQTPGLPHLQLLSFDACLMAMAEVAHRARNVGDVLVASQEIVGSNGYDYTTLLTSLVNNPYAIGAEQLGSAMVQSFQAQYSGTPNGWDTQSAIRSSAISTLVTAIAGFTSLTASANSAQLSLLSQALDGAIGYADADFRDLGSIMQGVVDRTALPQSYRTAAQAVIDALASAVVAKTSDVRASSGLSVFAPGAGNVGTYYGTEFSEFGTVTGWAQFVDRVGNASGRSGGSGRLGPAISIRDWAESNDVSARATDLFTLEGDQIAFTNLSLHNGSDIDWFRFNLTATGQATNQIGVSGDAGSSIQISLYDSSRTTLLHESTPSSSPSISLSNLGPGTYFLQVRSSNLNSVRQYRLSANAPTSSQIVDRFGDNSIAEKAFPLGLVGNRLVVPGLVLPAQSSDWFSIVTPRLSGGEWFSCVVNLPAGASLSALILDEAGEVVSRAAGSGTLRLGYFASGAAESYRIMLQNSSNVRVNYNFSISSLSDTYSDVVVNERLSGALVDSLPLTDVVGAVGNVLLSDNRFEWSNNSLRLKPGQFLKTADAKSVFVELQVSDANNASLTRTLTVPLRVEANARPFYNAIQPRNVSNDVRPGTGEQLISAIDALIVINYLNSNRPIRPEFRDASLGAKSEFVDVSGDGSVTSIDALLVINYLNNTRGEGEGGEVGPAEVLRWTAVEEMSHSLAAPGVGLPHAEQSRIESYIVPPEQYSQFIEYSSTAKATSQVDGALHSPDVLALATDHFFENVDWYWFHSWSNQLTRERKFRSR